MPLNSYEFMLVFLPLVFIGYCLVQRYGSRRLALGWLLFASVGFYAVSGVGGVLLVTLSVTWDYVAARLFIATPPNQPRLRRTIIQVAISVDILCLCYFKYLNFMVDTVNTLFSSHVTHSSVYLPLGLSFLTFQKIGFLTDLRSGQIKEPRLFDFALFCLFFPRAVAGPIIRYNDFTHQLQGSNTNISFADLAVGFCLVAIGLFKETVIASIAGQFVPGAFEPFIPNEQISFTTSWIGALAYTFQIYFEFSGYSDMALGIARLFGIRLPTNFNSPLKSNSLVEFWSRWHITLTRFLTWQIYIPMVRYLTRVRISAGKSALRGANSSLSAVTVLIWLPTLFTMTLSGLWHGAGWNYVLWGAMHGVCLSINQTWRLVRSRIFINDTAYKRVMAPIGRVLTLATVIVALVVFRSDSMYSAVTILRGMLGLNGLLPSVGQWLISQSIPPNITALMFTAYWYPCVCLGLFFLLVTMTPNSLELLSRLHPALDFPPDGRDAAPAPESSNVGASRFARWKERVTAAQDFVSPCRSPGTASMHIAVILYAIFFVLGVSAIERSGPFIYGQF